MPTFIYKAKKGPTEVTVGELEASSQEEAVAELDKLGLIPVSIAEKAPCSGQPGSRPEGAFVRECPGASQSRPAPAPVRARQETRQYADAGSGEARILRVKAKDLDVFTRQLSSLVKANVPILRALSLILDQSESRQLRGVVSGLQKDVRDGKMLSDAMAKYPRVFNNLYLNMVRSGERAGALDEVLTRLTEYREKEQEVRHKIQAAMAYPALMSVVGLGTVFIMLTFFLPKMTGLFRNMRQGLPLPTKILLGTSGFMSANWYWFVLGIGLFVAIFGRVRPGSKKKLLFDALKLYIPVVRDVIRNAEIAKFARSLGVLIKNGMPVYESLGLATNTLDNDALRRPLAQAGDDIVRQGATLSVSLRKAGVFPEFAMNMIAVGEEGGRLEEALSEIARLYEREVDQAIKIMTSLLEPLLILGVGTVVGFIVFAMLLPIFNIGMMAK